MNTGSLLEDPDPHNNDREDHSERDDLTTIECYVNIGLMLPCLILFIFTLKSLLRYVSMRRKTSQKIPFFDIYIFMLLLCTILCRMLYFSDGLSEFKAGRKNSTFIYPLRVYLSFQVGVMTFLSQFCLSFAYLWKQI